MKDYIEQDIYSFPTEIVVRSYNLIPLPSIKWNTFRRIDFIQQTQHSPAWCRDSFTDVRFCVELVGMIVNNFRLRPEIIFQAHGNQKKLQDFQEYRNLFAQTVDECKYYENLVDAIVPEQVKFYLGNTLVATLHIINCEGGGNEMSYYDSLLYAFIFDPKIINPYMLRYVIVTDLRSKFRILFERASFHDGYVRV